MKMTNEIRLKFALTHLQEWEIWQDPPQEVIEQVGEAACEHFAYVAKFNFIEALRNILRKVDSQLHDKTEQNIKVWEGLRECKYKKGLIKNEF